MGLWDSQLGGGGGGTAEALETPSVANFAALPSAVANLDKVYYVQNSTGVYLINRKNKGYYKSDGASWTPWEQDDLAADALAAHESAYPHALLNTLQAEILKRSLGA